MKHTLRHTDLQARVSKLVSRGNFVFNLEVGFFDDKFTLSLELFAARTYRHSDLRVNTCEAVSS